MTCYQGSQRVRKRTGGGGRVRPPRKKDRWDVERSARERWVSWAGGKEALGSKQLWWLFSWSWASGRAATMAEAGVQKQAGSVQEG